MNSDAHEIIPRLWLGNAKSSMNIDFIKKNNITVVMNCTKDRPFLDNIPVKIRLPVHDNLEEEEIENMRQWSFETVYNVLKYYRAGHTILIHCMAGIQRSAAVYAMFLIAYERLYKKNMNIHAEDVINYIKERRPIAFYKGVNFKRAIEYFDQMFHI